jgi:hypothetical protein
MRNFPCQNRTREISFSHLEISQKKVLLHLRPDIGASKDDLSYPSPSQRRSVTLKSSRNQESPAMNKLKLLSFGVLLATSASLAHATLITAGGATVTPGTTTIAAYTGTVVGTAGGTITTPTFSASWTETVYSGASGGLALGTCASGSCLDFVFNFTGISGDSLEQAAQSKYLGFLVDADYVPGTGVIPFSVNESGTGAVNWNYTSPNTVAPGSSSDTLVLYTNATVDKPGFFTLQDQTSGFQGDLGPAIVPEPSGLALLGTGLMTAVGIVRRKLKV